MIAIYKRELRTYMCSMYAPIFITFMFLAFGISSLIENIVYRSPQFESSLYIMSIIMIIAIPILTMRSMSEDKKNGTDRFLLSLPIKVSSVILGKYLAMLTVFAIPVAVICVMPLIFSSMGEVMLLQSYASIFAFFLLGACFIAVCMFLSSLTESQLISTILGVAALALFFIIDIIATVIPSSAVASFIFILVLCVIVALIAALISRNWIVTIITLSITVISTSICYIAFNSAFEGLASKILLFISPFNRFYLFTYGIFDLTSVTFFLAMIVFFVYLSTASLDKKRWG